MTMPAYGRRLHALQQYLQKANIDGIVLSYAPNIRYLTGFVGISPTELEILLVVFPDAAILVAPMMYGEQASELLAVKDGLVTCHVDDQRFGLFRCVADELKQHVATKIFVEEQYLHVTELKRLQALFSATFVDATGVVEKLRSVKDTEELTILQKAQQITIETFATFEKFLHTIDCTSLTERGCVEKIRSIALELGADDVSFPAIVASGVGASQPHYSSTTKHLENNTVLLVDLGAKVDGYNGDYTRTILLGSVDEEIRNIHAAVTDMNLQCQKACVAGVTGEQLYEVLNQTCTKHHIDQIMPHSLGHGIGLEVHEQPLLRPYKEQVLEKGNVVTIEPGVYIPGKFGVRVEDLVVIN